MADDYAATSESDLRPPHARSPEFSQSQGSAPAPAAHAEEEQGNSTAKGILKEAIQKVMEEIQFHEREAQKHRQQAEALKRDLRDSFAFLQEQKGRGKPGDTATEKAAAETPAARTETKTREPASAQSRSQADTKKKLVASKAKSKKG
jgi:hypothetical protein